MKNVNTEVAEQTNEWFSGRKNLFKYLNKARHKLLLFITCNEFNENKICKSKLLFKKYE